ncbi:MAG TPA: TetR family transcriptional regulator [Kofleriaceae bacterium]|nr:TetR family transcriptional regulator [Kofleriaceae bacterium]HMG55090.1 TetR family transcriptional regulator [Kofleriaceae bacterium]
MSGLRQRKKQETRARISGVGTALFFQRGFDAVSVSEIAEAANVSRMTVFNYFPRKEDIFFDRRDEAAELLRGAIRDRPRSATVLAALRALVLGLLSRGHPFVAVSHGVRGFWAVVERSDALRRHAGELLDQLETALAAMLVEAVQAPALDPIARIAAGMIWSVFREVYREGMRAVRDGDAADTVRRKQRELIHKGFDMLDAAFARTPYGRVRR